LLKIRKENKMIKSYDILKSLDKFSNEDLIKFYNNAYYTYAFCNGHFKGEQNLIAKTAYSKELAKRGITEIPDLEESEEIGFNGDGSY
jgi:hypothetical protein